MEWGFVLGWLFSSIVLTPLMTAGFSYFGRETKEEFLSRLLIVEVGNALALLVIIPLTVFT